MESKYIATNKKAFRDFSFIDKWECGIVLTGPEVKSLRLGQANFTDSFARIEQGEVILYNFHIAPYAQAGYETPVANRPRKLLMHKKEIGKISGLVIQKQYNLVPTKVYFNKRGIAKIELALGKGKKIYDRREDIKKRDVERETKRAQRSRQKGR